MTSSTSRWLRPLLLSAGAGFACLAIWWVFVAHRRGALVDHLVYRGSFITPWHLSARGERLLGVISVQGVAVAMVAVALTALLRRRWLLALEAAAVIAGANLSTRALKYHVLYRPEWDFSANFANNSYPSGHTTAATSAVVAALLVAPRGLRGVVAVLGSLVMMAFGFATVMAHWHRPSDVVGAYLVCLCWAFMALCVAAVRQRLAGGAVDGPPTRRPSRVLPGLMVAAGMVAFGVAAACGWLSLPVTDLEAATGRQQFIAYLGGSAGLCGVAAAGMGVLLRLVQLHDAYRTLDQYGATPAGRVVTADRLPVGG